MKQLSIQRFIQTMFIVFVFLFIENANAQQIQFKLSELKGKKISVQVFNDKGLENSYTIKDKDAIVVKKQRLLIAEYQGKFSTIYFETIPGSLKLKESQFLETDEPSAPTLLYNKILLKFDLNNVSDKITCMGVVASTGFAYDAKKEPESKTEQPKDDFNRDWYMANARIIQVAEELDLVNKQYETIKSQELELTANLSSEMSQIEVEQMKLEKNVWLLDYERRINDLKIRIEKESHNRLISITGQKTPFLATKSSRSEKSRIKKSLSREKNKLELLLTKKRKAEDDFNLKDASKIEERKGIITSLQATQSKEKRIESELVSLKNTERKLRIRITNLREKCRVNNTKALNLTGKERRLAMREAMGAIAESYKVKELLEETKIFYYKKLSEQRILEHKSNYWNYLLANEGARKDGFIQKSIKAKQQYQRALMQSARAESRREELAIQAVNTEIEFYEQYLYDAMEGETPKPEVIEELNELFVLDDEINSDEKDSPRNIIAPIEAPIAGTKTTNTNNIKTKKPKEINNKTPNKDVYKVILTKKGKMKYLKNNKFITKRTYNLEMKRRFGEVRYDLEIEYIPD